MQFADTLFAAYGLHAETFASTTSRRPERVRGLSMKHRRRFSASRKEKSRRGAAVVEMAIVMPLFFMLTWGIVEFGRAMMVSQLVTNAARDGARVAAADGSTNDTVQTAVEDFLTDALNISASDITVSIAVEAGAGNGNPGNDVANAQPGDKCIVTVTVPFDQVTLTKPDWLSGKTLTGFCAMRREW